MKKISILALYLAACAPAAPPETPSPKDDAAPPPAPTANPEPRTIACGSSACNVPDQMCCKGDEGGTCVERVQGDPSKMVEACPHRATLTCDDAGDCADDEVCCAAEYGSGGPPISTCQKSCEGDELCAGGGACRAKGTTCVSDGRLSICQLDMPPLRCPDEACTGGTTCCATPQGIRCAAEGECIPGVTIGCLRQADCAPAGMVCMRAPHGTGCVKQRGEAQDPACMQDDECAAFAEELCDGGKVSCDTEGGVCLCG